MVDQLFGAFIAMLGLASCQHRHESLAEGPLPQYPPKQIRYAKGDVVSISKRVDPKYRTEENIANEPSHTRSERQQRNGGGGFEERHSAGSVDGPPTASDSQGSDSQGERSEARS